MESAYHQDSGAKPEGNKMIKALQIGQLNGAIAAKIIGNFDPPSVHRVQYWGLALIASWRFQGGEMVTQLTLKISDTAHRAAIQADRELGSAPRHRAALRADGLSFAYMPKSFLLLGTSSTFSASQG